MSIFLGNIMKDTRNILLIRSIAFSIKGVRIILRFFYGSIFYTIILDLIWIIVGFIFVKHTVTDCENPLLNFPLLAWYLICFALQLFFGYFYLLGKIDDKENKEPQIILKICSIVIGYYKDVKNVLDETNIRSKNNI